MNKQEIGTEYIGAGIVDVEIKDNQLILWLSTGKQLAIFDDGQCCCENRYMRTDDDPKSLVGGILLHIVSKDGPEIKTDEFEYHEQTFIEVATSKGFITLCNHNEHNGYYGGFDVTIREVRR